MVKCDMLQNCYICVFCVAIFVFSCYNSYVKWITVSYYPFMRPFGQIKKQEDTHSMRKFAKLLSLLLASIIIMGAVAANASAATNFSDVAPSNEELYEAVTLLNALGIAKGKTETSFGVKDNVTREQMAAFIYRMMKKGKSAEGGENHTPFTDLTDPTFYSMISWASTLNIIKGTSTTTFNPKGQISLQDCYVMLVRTLGYEKDEQLVYPFGYINIAESIGLNENLSHNNYTAALTRGEVALILYNAFYADMNETYLTVEIYEGNLKVDEPVANKEVPETISHKIYGVQKIVRRVVATPSYAIDMSALGSGNEYQMTKNIKPTADDTIDIDLIQTAAIVPEQNNARLEKENYVLEFPSLGLPGKADDYFLHDLIIYMDEEGKIFGAMATGEVVDGASVKLPQRTGTYKEIDYYRYDDNNKNLLYTGTLDFGADKGYYYAKPDKCPNFVVSICPVDGDGEGSMTFKAGYTWYGEIEDRYNTTNTHYLSGLLDKDVDFYASFRTNGSTTSMQPATDINYTGTNTSIINRKRALVMHDGFEKVMGNLIFNDGKAFTKYYDCNNDNYVDYLWVMPMTFGLVEQSKNETKTIDKKHVGDSKYRAYWNGEDPAIQIADAYIDGDAYTVGDYALAYVAGPAKYVRFADEEVQSSIKYLTAQALSTSSNGGQNNTIKWDVCTTNAYNSATIIVGHINYAKNVGPNGLLALKGQDVSNDQSFKVGDGFATPWRESVTMGDVWNLVLLGNRVLLAEPVDTAGKIAENYAVVQYIDKSDNQVIFKAGGIEMDGSLESDNYLQAYIGGELKVVKVAKKNDESDSGLHDDEYFVNGPNGVPLVENVSRYEVNAKGEYSFYEVEDSADASNLKDTQDETLTYVAKGLSNFSLTHYVSNLYRFVPAADWDSIPSALKPNGMQNVILDDNAVFVIKYVNDAGEADFKLYDAATLPAFDTESVEMAFDNAVVVLSNKADSTTTEYLTFMYAEIGSDIIYESDVESTYGIIVGVAEGIDEDGDRYFEYDVYDPITGEKSVRKPEKNTTSQLAFGSIYEFTTKGTILNTDSGFKANLNGSLKSLAEYHAEAGLLELKGVTDMLTVDDKTVVGVYDKSDMTYEVVDVEALLVQADDVDADEYYTGSEIKLCVVTEKVSGEDFDRAHNIIIVIE